MLLPLTKSIRRFLGRPRSNQHSSFHPARHRAIRSPNPNPAALLILTLFFALCASAQEPATNARPAIFRDRITPHWFSGDNKFWYRLDLADDHHEFILVDAVQGKRGPAFDHSRLAQALSQQSGNPVTADQLPFTTIKFSDDAKSFQFAGKDDTVWKCDLDTYQLAKVEGGKIESSDAPDDSGTARGRGRSRGRTRTPPSRPGATSPSPDGKWEAFIHGHNLYLRDLATSQEIALSYDGNPGNSYARDFQRARGVEMETDTPEPEPSTPDVRWSPDSRHLVAMRTRPGAERRVYYVESSPKDQLQPKLHSYPYLKPGDEIPIQKPHLFDVESKKEIPVDDALFPNPWSINELRWSTNSSSFTFVYNQRGHQVLRIVSVDAKTGEARPIVDEKSATFIDYSGQFYAHYLGDAGEIIWMSERDGWNHLYLYDAATGRVKNQITKGEWLVRGVDRVDEEKRQIWFRAGGIRPGQDPYYIHYCRVNFDGSGLTILTEGDGTHTAAWSPDRRFFIDTYSRVDLPPVNELRRAGDGGLVCDLEKADVGARDTSAAQWPERFVAKGRDGLTDIYGIITRPRHFDAQKKYPVIESIYAGPQDSFVPKAFSPVSRVQTLADRGFIIVQIDGMGTANRSRKFHDVCWKNLVDGGFPDRILWIKTAAAKYPSMDLSRVGIYGTSAGGQNALAGLLTHGDFYTAGVADSGSHDNRMDKIWWNEQWMGWPPGPEYEENSNVTLAHNLKGKLLLMIGEMDENVDPSTSMQVVNALIKANKDFELLVMPGQGHGVAGTAYGRHRLSDFFVRTLLEPAGETEARTTTASAIDQTHADKRPN